MIIGFRQRLSTIDNYDLKVRVDKDPIHKVSKTKSLAIIITKKMALGIDALKQMRDYVTKETAIQVHQGLVQPYFSSCAPVWDGIGKTLSEKLQKLQNRAACAITRTSSN